jgi:hypothetical protein
MIYLEANSMKEMYEKLGQFNNVHSIQILKEDSKLVCIAQDEPINVIIQFGGVVDGGLPVWINGGQLSE